MSDYRVEIVERPEGWQPRAPLDVPDCPGKISARPDRQRMTHAQAVATVTALNRQCINHPGTNWYVIVPVEGESKSESL